jgi:hypothetical protein
VRTIKYRFNYGVVLTELIIAMAINTMIIIAVGLVLVSGNKAWQRAYETAHSKVKQDAEAITVAFGNTGRKSNRLSYVIYDVDGSSFTPAEPTTTDLETVSGNAVEFRYWDVELDETDSEGLIDIAKIATAYALFYLDDDQLKVDHGSYPPGGVPEGGGNRNTSDVVTRVLADNVSVDPNIGAFSHTTLGGMGQGAVRINAILTDPESGESIRVMTSTLMRNIWPR